MNVNDVMRDNGYFPTMTYIVCPVIMRVFGGAKVTIN